MRLFYDRYTTRPRAELTLVAADMLAVVAATLYLAPALLGEAHPLDTTLLIIWAATPRALARILVGLEQPTGFGKVLSAATVAVVLIAALLGVGWDLIHSASPPGYAPTPLGLGMLLCAWAAGFLVCQPGAYRLFDFFLGGAFLVGLKDGAPQPYIWIPVFFLAICTSAAVRHLIHDVFPNRRSPPINLQNARVVALLGAGLATFAFLTICLALGGGRFPEPTPRLDDPTRRFTSAGSTAPGRGTRDESGGGATWRGGGPAGAGAHSGGPGGSGGESRRIGFTEHVRLSDLARPEMDRAIVLRVRAPEPLSDARWQQLEGTLWKGLSLATYDAATQGWKQPTTLEEAPWPARLPRDVPEGLEERDAVTLVHFVINPVFENFITPYFTGEISTEDTDTRFLTYIRSLPGDDVFPQPAFRPYSTYRTRTVLVDRDDLPEIAVKPGSEDVEKIDPRYLEVPAPAELGVDLREEARGIFSEEASPRARLETLRRYFQTDFSYSVNEDWTGGDTPLREFLLEHRRGDCTYFATASALLLRAAGLPTRFVAGFFGGEWKPEAGELVIRNGRAHGWIEVHVEGAGWYPVDPTSWLAPSRDTIAGGRTLPEEGPDAEPPSDAEDEAAEEEGLLAEDGSLQDETPPAGADDPAAAGGALESEAPERASTLPRGGDDSTLPGVVKGLRGFVRREPRSGGGDETTRAIDDRRRGDESTDERPSKPATASSRGPLLSPAARVVIRAVFLILSLIVAGLLVYVLVRPRRKKKDDEAEEDDEEEEPLHVPAESSYGLSPVFDRSSASGRVLAAYHELQESLKSTRNHRRPHQTPLEHAHWLGEKPSETDESFLHVHRILYHVLYGGQDVNEDDVRSVERHCQKIRRALG